MKAFRNFMLSLFVLGLILKVISGIYVNYIWFKDLGYTQLFTTPLITKILIGAITFLLYFVMIYIMGIVALKVYRSAETEEVKFKSRFRIHLVEDFLQPEEKKPFNENTVKRFILAASLGLSLLFSTGVANGWINLLSFLNLTNFGISEDVFGKDISFYVFKMPFYKFILGSLTSSTTIIFLISLFIFPLTGLIHFGGSILKKGSIVIPKSIRRFWAVLIAILFALIAANKLLSMYEIIYSRTGYVYGAGYTDIHVTVPLSITLAIVALIGSVSSILYFYINDQRLILASLTLYIGVAILGAVAHGLVQYDVSNNEFIKEKTYIADEIKFTRIAYNIDKIKVKDYPGNAPLNMSNINNNNDTMENIRLNDPLPLKTVLSQNQGLRYYYRFNDIDIDRYMLNDKYRQVFLSARELSEDALTEKANTFVNMTMRYTHGYGLAATLANEIDESGYAKLIVKDIPPSSDIKGVEIKEPRVYFGELTNDTTYGYVIANTLAKEFDYPKGDENAENTYKGTTGLAMQGLNKLLLSAYNSTLRFYIASEITKDSKLLMRRNIMERVNTLMPYLSYDNDPYLVIAENGRLYWLLDAYTFTDKFPYSSPIGGINYIRNPVKVVIDPYNGTVDFFVFDNKDPLIKTLSKIFPGVFKDASLLPSNLIEHIRYPEDYFRIQSNILLNFHVNNLSVFYNREDTWDIAKRIEEGGTTNIDPYYSIMKLPEEDKSEFILMLPFTPASRQEQHRNNLVAWLAARNDAEHYGELILYKMPKNVEVQGPLMIESLIDQDPVISGKLTLWGQGGSAVIRGNLMAVPIDGGFIYVEPIYIRAEKQGVSIPQMQAIVFAIDKKVVMVETNSLDKSIAKFFAIEGMKEPTQQEPTRPTEPRILKPKDSILEKIEDLKRQLEELEEAVRSM